MPEAGQKEMMLVRLPHPFLRLPEAPSAASGPCLPSTCHSPSSSDFSISLLLGAQSSAASSKSCLHQSSYCFQHLPFTILFVLVLLIRHMLGGQALVFQLENKWKHLGRQQQQPRMISFLFSSNCGLHGQVAQDTKVISLEPSGLGSNVQLGNRKT